MKKTIRNIETNPNGTLIFNRTKQYLAYADVVVLLERAMYVLEECYELLAEIAKNVGFKINYEKTKYIHDNLQVWQQNK